MKDQSPKRLSRRDFLRIAGLTAAGTVLGGVSEVDPYFGIVLDKEAGLGYRESLDLAFRLDRVYDLLPEWKPETTRKDFENWVRELAPMFEYNGIVDHAIIPSAMEFTDFTDGQKHNHVLGQSNCADLIRINARVTNPHSSWYQSEDFPFTVAHELAHVQQQESCVSSSSEKIESSAQVAALEVMCSLANGGNTEAIRAVIGELRDMAMTTAYGWAIERNDLPRFIALRNRMSPGALSEARFYRAMRRWEKRPMELKSLIAKYYRYPLEIILEASKNEGQTYLAFPPILFTNYGGSYVFNPEPQPIVLDDTLYFLKNMERMAREV